MKSKKKKPRTRGATLEEFRAFASWCATNRGTMKDNVFDWNRFGRLAENKAQELFKPRCVECDRVHS